MQKMISFYDVKKENIKEHYPNSPQKPDHHYITLIIGGSESGKQVHQQDIDKIYLYTKDSYDAKY